MVRTVEENNRGIKVSAKLNKKKVFSTFFDFDIQTTYVIKGQWHQPWVAWHNHSTHNALCIFESKRSVDRYVVIFFIVCLKNWMATFSPKKDLQMIDKTCLIKAQNRQQWALTRPLPSFVCVWRLWIVLQFLGKKKPSCLSFIQSQQKRERQNCVCPD